MGNGEVVQYLICDDLRIDFALYSSRKDNIHYIFILDFIYKTELLNIFC